MQQRKSLAKTTKRTKSRYLEKTCTRRVKKENQVAKVADKKTPSHAVVEWV